MDSYLDIFDKRHVVCQEHVTPIEEIGIKINSQSFNAWNKYCEDYDLLKNEENAAEGEEFMRPMPSLRKYLEKENFLEKQQRKLKIGTYSGKASLQKIKFNESDDEVEEVKAPPTLQIERIQLNNEEECNEDVDYNDAFLSQKIIIPDYKQVYKTSNFTNALSNHTEDMDEMKKALWNDCIIFVSNEEKVDYSVHFLRSHAFPDKMFILKKLNDWKINMNTIGKQRDAHSIVIKNLLGKEFYVSNIPYRLDQVEELRNTGRQSGAYLINLVGKKSLI